MDFKFKKRSPNKTGKGKTSKSPKQQVQHEKNHNGKAMNSKIRFDDDGNKIETQKYQMKKKPQRSRDVIQDDDIGSRWYEEFKKFNASDEELVEMKDNEIQELTKTCRNCFGHEEANFQKKNPSDAKWLETALHKGTSKDRANAGALLVQSNPIGNVKTLDALIGLTKLSNKANGDAIDTITQLFISGLLPPYRKLMSIPMRGASWKALKKNTELEKNTKDRIMACWHFETLLKDHYFDYLRNLQAAMQGNQDASKNQAIVCASRLLTYAPEKEQMLLSMLINKLGDPSTKVASKALYHLTEVAYKHPAMCNVIAKETEKLLFRNNITEQAQHFALCFLAQIATRGTAEVCTRLVRICFAFFKIVIQKGAVNTKTMQAILRCLKRAIIDAKTNNSDSNDCGYLTKDILDTMYRLIHLADIHISLQTFALLLQVLSVKSTTGKDRYYNALYRKMLDINLVNVGPKAIAQFLHILHRSIYMDANVPRAQAFIKRLLQIAFTFPAQITCGCLIVVHKLIKSRPELNRLQLDVDTKLEDSTVDLNETTATEIESTKIKNPCKYDPFHRAPAFSGAQFTNKTELLRLSQHYHPTIQIFAKNIIEGKHIDFYGDPLRDFCLTQFLERFAFRNPRKLEEKETESLVQSIYKNKNQYKSHGGRGMPVKSLTEQNCTEDERFIFRYLEEKRVKRAAYKKDDEESITSSVDDNEFEDYLDGLGGGGDDGGDDDGLDFMNELGEQLKKDEKKTKKKKMQDEDEDADGDWDDETDVADESKAYDKEVDEMDSDDEGSISLDDDDGDSDIFEEDSADDASVLAGSDLEDDEPKAKKFKSMNSKDFQKTLKHTTDMNSLFAAADDFAEMLDETGKSKKHGTLGDIFNKDKSSEKQLKWEERRAQSHKYSKSHSFKGQNAKTAMRHKGKFANKNKKNK